MHSNLEFPGARLLAAAALVAAALMSTGPAGAASAAGATDAAREADRAPGAGHSAKAGERSGGKPASAKAGDARHATAAKGDAAARDGRSAKQARSSGESGSTKAAASTRRGLVAKDGRPAKGDRAAKPAATAKPGANAKSAATAKPGATTKPAAAVKPAATAKAASAAKAVAAGTAVAAAARAAAGTEPDADFGARPEAREFAQQMAERHGFAADELAHLFARTRRTPEVLRLIAPPAPTFKRSWSSYRARFLDPLRIREGVRFWNDNADALARAEREYGVPAEIVAGIIGVETIYGRNTGGFRVMDALATLAFDYPRRAPYFRGELEQFLLYARDEGIDPMSVRGSFAGAIGMPQFMPTSLRSYAVDFDGDGRIDLRGNPADAVGSVARFLAMHGWQRDGRTHWPAQLAPDAATAPLVDAGLEPRFTVEQLQPHGVRPVAGAEPPPGEKLALVDLPNGDEPTSWYLGATNFYVVTRYNRSSFYAMAVIELAEAVRQARALTAGVR